MQDQGESAEVHTSSSSSSSSFPSSSSSSSSSAPSSSFSSSSASSSSPPSLPVLSSLTAAPSSTSTSSTPSSSSPPSTKRKRGGNRKGSSNWKRREQNVLLDLLESTPRFPSKLDDWNALCVLFNEKISAMGFPLREGKSLRKKWQVLISSKGVEGEGLNEQEMRAQRLAKGEAGLKMEESVKRQRVEGFVSSSPLAPLPLSSPVPPPDVSNVSRDAVGVAVRALRSLLAGRQAEFERREYVWAEWRRKDIEEREKMRELLDAIIALDEEEGKSNGRRK